MFEDDQEAFLRIKRIDTLRSQLKTATAAALIISTLLGFLFVPAVGWLAYGAWVAAMILAYTARNYKIRSIKAEAPVTPRDEKTVVFSSAMLGFVINLPGAFFIPHMAPEISGVYVAIATGWMATALVLIGIHPYAYGLYIATGFTLLSIGWWQVLSPTLAFVTSLAMVAAAVLLFNFSRKFSAHHDDAAAGDWKLKQAKNETDQLNAQLEEKNDKLEEANVDLDLLNRELEERNQKLDRLNRQRTRFLDDIAHDLRGALQVMNLKIGEAQEVGTQERIFECVESIQDSAQELDAMLEAILDRERKPRFESVGVEPILRHMCDEFEDVCLKQGIELTVTCPSNLRVVADSNLLMRIVRNLVDNAVKFTAAGRIDIATSADEAFVHIAVQDTGMGIPEEDIKRVTEPRFRSAGAAHIRGSGLGLAGVAENTERMFGEMAIRSVLGEGTTVTISLPRSYEQTAQDSVQTPAPRGVEHSSVLLIDDDRSILDKLDAQLSEVVSVRAFQTLDEAMACLDEGEFAPTHLVVDYDLGQDTNGLDAISALRQKLGEIPATLITGQRLARSELPGSVGYLAKPFSVEQLVKQL